MVAMNLKKTCKTGFPSKGESFDRGGSRKGASHPQHETHKSQQGDRQHEGLAEPLEKFPYTGRLRTRRFHLHFPPRAIATISSSPRRPGATRGFANGDGPDF